MAGTRLVVHTLFVIQLILLVGVSFYYASTKPHDPSDSAEPFLPDQSGWRILVEDVSPSSSRRDDENGDAADGGIVGIIATIRECGSILLSQVQSLIGKSPSAETATPPHHHHDSSRRRPSAFVQEMRRSVAAILNTDGGATSTTQNRIAHPLKVVLSIPQANKLSYEVEFLVKALEKGVLSHRHSRSVRLLEIILQSTSSGFNDVDIIEACDDYHPPRTTYQSIQRPNHRVVKYPEIILLIGCTSATIPDPQRMSSVEVLGNSDTIIVRSKRTFDQRKELLSELENEISNQILSNIFISSTLSEEYEKEEYRRGNVFVNLIDENPSSHIAGQSSISAKDRFDIIGNALSSSVISVIGPWLEDLSFINGGEIEQIKDGDAVIHSMGKIGLEAHSTAFLPLPDDSIVSIAEEDGQESMVASPNYVSSDGLASWMHGIHPGPVGRRNAHSVVHWTLFVPSHGHAPLMVRDEENGEIGESIILSHSGQYYDAGRTTTVYRDGVSIVNLPAMGELFELKTGNVDISHQSVYQMYQDTISNSLVHLVGFLRARYGLPVFTTSKLAGGEEEVGLQTLTFWELETIARSHYPTSLEYALHQTDALFAVLHRHGRSLALPMDVANKLNNATHLLRQSISLIEQGYPAIYATSLIHGSIHYLESVQRDHRVYELPYFAIDHYLAVFSPLVLPLLLPMLAGLVREVKRYRELRKKKSIV
jgi:hypothetical protein